MVCEILNVNSKHIFSFKYKIYIMQKSLSQIYKINIKNKILLVAT